jgi:PKD repeat protein
VYNLPPTIAPLGPFTVDEGSPLTLMATATDPGSDDLTFEWQFELGPTITNIHYNDGIGPDPYPSPGGTFPFTATDSVTHTYGDNGIFNVTLTVSDDDGLAVTVVSTIVVNNVAPAATLEAYVFLSFTLRAAGEKWHDVEMHILEDGADIGYARVVRYPGSPDDQSVTLSRVKCHVTKEITVRVLYTPFDDPINGQTNGANPAWILVRFEDDTMIELHHTFGVQHPETWEWNVGINQYLVGHEITFEATAIDPGSDDLTFSWVWGDGSPDESATYYNDGIGPDPFRSPWGTYPFTALDARTHTYFTAGTFTLVLGVQDDDGGLTELLVIIILI